MSKINRESNFELFRIICMVMVVTLHVLGHGGAIEGIEVNTLNFYIAHFLESFSIVAVNCYILISGYFGVNSEFKIKKVLMLYFQILFYSIFISVTFWAVGIEKVSIGNLINTILPITTQVWWFVTLYLILYILTPYINKLMRSMSEEEFKRLIIILIAIFVIWPSVRVKLKPIDNLSGYSLYQFIFMYIIGGYVRLFYKEKKLKRGLLILVYLISCISLLIFNVGVSTIIGKSFGIYSYNFILVFISSISLFLFFKEISLKSNIVNRISSLTLGVYLIHDHPFMRNYIYKFLGYDKSFSDSNFIIYTLLIVIIIFSISLIIEYIRQKVFTMIGKYIKN